MYRHAKIIYQKQKIYSLSVFYHGIRAVRDPHNVTHHLPSLVTMSDDGSLVRSDDLSIQIANILKNNLNTQTTNHKLSDSL